MTTPEQNSTGIARSTVTGMEILVFCLDGGREGLTFPIAYRSRDRKSRPELRQELKQRPLRMAAPWLVAFLHNPGPPTQVALLTVSWLLPHQSSPKSMAQVPTDGIS